MELAFMKKEPGPRKHSARNTTGIPNKLKQQFEAYSGFSFDDVKVHYNSDKPRQMQALAYTQAEHVYVAPGQERHLGHELGHIVQQRRGQVHATGRLNGQAVNDSPVLEHEADVMASQAAHLNDESKIVQNKGIQNHVDAPVQRKVAKAGVELQCGGVHIFRELNKGNLTSLNKGDVICYVGNKGSKIEVDSDELEYVSNVFESSNDLFEDLEAARQELEYMIRITYGQTQYRGTDMKGIYHYGSEEYHLRPTSNSQWCAKPQITFQIGKGKLNDFVSRLETNSVHYDALQKNKKIYINDDVENKIAAGFQEIDNITDKDISAKALAKLAWQMFICAHDDSKPYYKARFPIMPRTSLKYTYSAMSDPQKTDFAAIVEQLTPLITQERPIFNFVYDEKRRRHVPQEVEALAQEISPLTAWESIYKTDMQFTAEEDREKHLTVKNGKTEEVDALSSDTMASVWEVGNSVGAYDLPNDADSIIEIREGMPVVQINNQSQVEAVYDSVLKHYSGENERDNYIGV